MIKISLNEVLSADGSGIIGFLYQRLEALSVGSLLGIKFRLFTPPECRAVIHTSQPLLILILTKFSHSDKGGNT